MITQKPQRSLPITLYLIQKSPYYTYPAVSFPRLPKSTFLNLPHYSLNKGKTKRFNIDFDDNCIHCKQVPEDLQHIFYCPASQPAVKWMRRKIAAIDPSLTKENNLWIFTFNCSIVDSNRKFSVLWLEANFISPIWRLVNKFTHNWNWFMFIAFVSKNMVKTIPRTFISEQEVVVIASCLSRPQDLITWLFRRFISVLVQLSKELRYSRPLAPIRILQGIYVPC